jgi:hypothetical protein
MAGVSLQELGVLMRFFFGQGKDFKQMNGMITFCEETHRVGKDWKLKLQVL